MAMSAVLEDERVASGGCSAVPVGVLELSWAPCVFMFVENNCAVPCCRTQVSAELHGANLGHQDQTKINYCSDVHLFRSWGVSVLVRLGYLLHQLQHDGFLHVQSVFGLLKDGGA